jgi:tRNA dimethylallyltransferase
MTSRKCSRELCDREIQGRVKKSADSFQNTTSPSARKIVVVAGPTASGKSTLAVELAHRFAGEIVNADSMQVYRGMDVGTAKLTLEERQGIPHHLLDVVNPDENFNAAIYRSLALPVIADILSRGKVCLLVGGTGLYIRSLLGGLLYCPPVDQGIRDDLWRQCDEEGAEALHQRLTTLDPESGRKIHPRDKVRITRALEIIQLTNQPLSSLVKNHGFKDRALQALKICLQMEREGLYHRINQRSLAMVEKGLIEETEVLLGKGYSPEIKPMKSLGYRHAVRYLEGDWSLDRMIGELQRDTRRYAKRQLTWFRADPEMKWFDLDGKASLFREIGSFIRKEE